MAIRKAVITVDDVVEQLGGTARVAKLTRRKMAAVSNWRAKGRFARATFAVIGEELRRRGINAPPSLWGIDDPYTRNV